MNRQIIINKLNKIKFKEITEIKNRVSKEIYIKYLEKVIRILLKNQFR